VGDRSNFALRRAAGRRCTLRDNPWSPRRFGSRTHYEQKALRQGQVAVNSILRDWIKGQVTAIECGIPHMLTDDGRPLMERIAEAKMLPAPQENVVKLVQHK
jgi:hypothetical protein